ncbi:nuclear transport factor 2 family protein [Gemmatimonadota bacterium]
MKKPIALFAVALLAAGAFPQDVSAQTAEEDVVAVVSQLFEGMRTRDAELLRSLFHPDALMTGTGMRDGSYRVSMNPPDGWIESVASHSGAEIDERFYDPKVEVSGPLASVWTEYDLYLGDEFRHCGVDAFHLALTDDGWKIVHLADTRVQDGCPAR